MNYRHGFHAGNFADVFKHAILARLFVHLARKETPFRFIDTHAGAGRYDLASQEARRSPEWRDGVARLAKARPPAPVAALLAPYLKAIGPFDADGRPASYPGSPALAQALLRPQDRMALCEAHPEERAALVATLGRDGRLSIVGTDGYLALNAYVPPKERRGVALIDPPYEQPDESARVEKALARALAKWSRGIYALWQDAARGRPLPQRDWRARRARRAAARTRRRRRRAERAFAEPAEPRRAPRRQPAVRPDRGGARPHALADAPAAARRARRIRLRMADGAEVMRFPRGTPRENRRPDPGGGAGAPT